jgi:hypothetical protein
MKKIVFASTVAVIIFVLRCGGNASLLDAPEITRVTMGASSVKVEWAKDTTIEYHLDFNGYNIYAYTDSNALLVDDGEDLNKINSQLITSIDTVPNIDFTINGLSQDSIYYIQVRTVNTDNKVGGYNSLVPFVKASPRPEFTAVIRFEMNTPGIDDSCAIRFSDASVMADSTMANGGADMWVDVFPVVGKDTVSLDSPSHNAQWGVGARVSKFLNLGQHNLEDITEVTAEPINTTYVPVDQGDLVIVKTADNHYVKVHLDTIDKTGNAVTITYAYQNIENFPYFSP